MNSQTNKGERIEFRISPHDKEIFLKAQKLSGDRTFSGFITRVVRMQAESIISEKERILESKKDRKIFFDAVFGNQKPNRALVAAAKKYKSAKDGK